MQTVGDDRASQVTSTTDASAMRCIRCLSALLLLWLALPGAAATPPAAAPPSTALADALRAVRAPIGIGNDGLHGAGARRLIEQARAATFIVVGEDHGHADVPRFVLALDRALGADAPPNLVAEIGPFAARRVAAAVAGDDVAAAARAHPGSTPFFEWRDDLALARHYVRRGGADALWGIDQEFVLSATPNLEALREAAPAAGRPAIDALLARARQADATLRAAGRPDAALLLSWTAADSAALRASLGEAPAADALRRLAALDESATIYRLQSSAPFESNRQRARLMKREFMARWNATPAPRRAMMRLGAFHAVRGLTPTGQFDLGNLASELAESTGGESLHVLVVAGGGTVNAKLPFLADEALREAPYPARERVAVLGVVPLLDAADADAWTVFDLAPLRANAAAREAGGPAFARLVHGFDLVVVVPNAQAARDVLPD